MNRHHQPSGWWVVGKGKPPANQPPKPNRCQLFWLARSLVLLPRVSVKATKLFMSHPSAEYSLPPSVVRCPFWQCESPFCSVRSNCRQEICPLKANASLWQPVWIPIDISKSSQWAEQHLIMIALFRFIRHLASLRAYEKVWKSKIYAAIGTPRRTTFEPPRKLANSRKCGVVNYVNVFFFAPVFASCLCIYLH